MRPGLLLPLTFALAAPSLPAQDLIGITINGDVYHLDGVTAARTLIGSCGFNNTNCLAKSWDGSIYSFTASFTSVVPSRLVEIDPNTGIGTQVASFAPMNVSAAAFDHQDRLFLIVYNSSSTMELWRLDSFAGSPMFVSALPVSTQPIQSLTFEGGDLWAWSNTDQFCTNQYGLGLVRIDPLTGALTDVGPLGDPSCNDIQSLGTGPNGELWAAGLNTWTVDAGTGAATIFGVTWTSSFRGLEFLGALGPLLVATGTVPGQVTLTISGATPNDTVAILYGTAGTFVKNGNPCDGLILDIASPTLGGLRTTDGAGVATLTFQAPPSAAGKTVQAVDVADCGKSNAVVLM
jgi:hypothetical protein